MKEKVFCVICSKRKWIDVEMIEVKKGEYKIVGQCPKCKTPIYKILKPQN